jgi:tRNA-dihydrouridine synthase
MKQPDLTRDLLLSISESKGCEETAVSLKCRIAVYDTPDDMTTDGRLSEEQYEKLHNYIAQAHHEGGISHLVLHARGAVLSGLSPTKNRQVPSLDYDAVERVSRDFPSLQVTLNGGISGMSHLADTSRQRSNDVTSFMAGRWMLRRPLDLARVQERSWLGNDETNSLARRTVKAVEQYADYARHCMEAPASKQSSSPTLSDLCLPLYMITEQLREDYDSSSDDLATSSSPETPWLADEDMESIYDVICETVEWLQEARGSSKAKKFSKRSVEFNKLASAFKGLVGTKVANKWKRNRAEL